MDVADFLHNNKEKVSIECLAAHDIKENDK